MHPNTPSPDSTQRIERFQSLLAGQYWRALAAIPEEGIDGSEVLLIESIRWVDDAPHTIILRAHPSKIGTTVSVPILQADGSTRATRISYNEHRFLLADFLARFEFEPDHQRLRADEIQSVQNRITAIQHDLIEAQCNPALLASIVETELSAREQSAQATSPDGEQAATPQPGTSVSPAASAHQAAIATGTVANAIGGGITTESIAALKSAAGREHEIATIKSHWIQAKTSEIANTIRSLTPFYEEQAAAALAQTEDVRTYVSKLMQGIESLDLYVGKNVTVETICTGTSAPRDIPLTFMQKKLLMDEELAVFTDVDEWFDFSKEALFFDALRAHPELIAQLFPTERCILVMATTRRHIDYDDTWSSAARNAENANVFLLARDGENVYRILSPVESHLGAARLFPSTDDQDRVFRGIHGDQIKFEDVAYTDRLANHEKIALHFKRFLLLVCGLDHRLKLFGDFYDGPPTLDFVSLSFQERYCRFLHDDERLLSSPDHRPPLSDWLKTKNAFLRSGSRVLCRWGGVMNPTTAPGACKSDSSGRGRFDRPYTPADALGIAIVYRESESLCVNVTVSGHSYSARQSREFECKVNLSKYAGSLFIWETDNSDLSYLCLDDVSIDDVRWYIHNRNARRSHLSYIRFFKHAERFLVAERAAESDTRRRMAEALQAGGIVADPSAIEAIVHRAVIAWRAEHRGAPLPGFIQDTPADMASWKSLLDQMYLLAGDGDRRATEIAAFVQSLGYQPLRLVLSGRAKLIVYAAPTEAEQDNRLEPHAWVHRIQLVAKKSGYSEARRSWAILPQAVASETLVHEWEESVWAGRTSLFTSFAHKKAVFDCASGAIDQLRSLVQTESESTRHVQWERARERYLATSRYVRNPIVAIPFGVALNPKRGVLRLLCVVHRTPHALLYALAQDDAARKRFRTEFIEPYENKHEAGRQFDADVQSHDGNAWSLVELPIEVINEPGFPYTYHDGARLYWQPPADPLLGSWLDAWRQKNAENTVVWLPDSLGSDGAAQLDTTLGITRPLDFEPTSVFRILVDDAGDYADWFDLVPSNDPRLRDDNTVLAAVRFLSVGHNGVRSSQFGAQASPAAARTYMQAMLNRDTPEKRLVPAVDLPDAPAAPDGVERWYTL